jgi:hypothetical protein
VKTSTLVRVHAFDHRIARLATQSAQDVDIMAFGRPDV